MRIRRAVRQHKLDPQSFFVRSRTCFRGEAFSEGEILRLSHREIHFDRVDSRNRSHRSARRAHQSTHLELRLPCNAIDRCDEPGELEVDPRRFDRSLRSLNLGFGSFHACYGREIVLNRVVEILLRSSLLSGQRSVPLDIKLGAALYGLGAGKLGFGLCQLTFGLVQCCLKWPWVDLEKELSFLDKGTLLITLLDQVPCHLRPDICID